MINLAKQNNCTGCAACSNRCRHNAIKLLPNDAGFLYPSIDKDKCIECGECVFVCPVIKKPITDNNLPLKAFIMQSKSSNNLLKYASGGFFSECAENFIQNNGDAVVGAVFDEYFNVFHTICTKSEDLIKLGGSKYVQSSVGNVYRDIEKRIQAGEKICFSGTPCQVAGLKSFLKKAYDNLVTVDFLCHSAPSPKAWRIYLNHQQKKYGKVTHVQFKSKHYGYSFPTLSLTTLKNNKEEHHYFTSQADAYMSAFLHGRISRECCEECRYRNVHMSDITVADYYKYANIPQDFNKTGGISRVIAWNIKGQNAIDTVKERFYWAEMNVNSVFEKTDFTNLHAKKINFETLCMISEEKFFAKNFRVVIKSKIKSWFRVILYKLGLQDFVKKIIKG